MIKPWDELTEEEQRIILGELQVLEAEIEVYKDDKKG